MARIITIIVLCGYTAVPLLEVLRDDPPLDLLLMCLGSASALFFLQLLHSSPRARRWTAPWKTLTLTVQSVLTFLPFLWLGITWAGMGGILGSSLLLMLPAPLSWFLFALVAAVIDGYAFALRLPAVTELYTPLTTLLTGLVLYGLTRLTDLVHEVHSARTALARMAVAQERMRFSRDVHDLLGYSLSAITLKCELIHRLVVTNPARAQEEVTAVLGVSRQALADARLVARSYREMSLSEEAESAATVLAAADIRVTLDISCGRLHPAVDTALATTLREGVTNVLRHSKAQSCTITAVRKDDTVWLTLVNDGVVDKDRPLGPGGSGLSNLAARLGAIGGRVTSGTRRDGRFHLEAHSPVRPGAICPEHR
ncbi:sensor histidine kinase [Streptomyces sp. NPDC018045]|uniref:sensor histidine kinase n=1 Tax=Streptomyces sp. NPDC018045 TaxID=3365037 RepID=UPI003798928A